jgi:hypothetical protein
MTSKKAREFRRTTIRNLDTLSSNQCAAPGCTKPLIASDGETIISKICHIEAASDDGPRFNPRMTDEDRRHFSNLILLCDEHHRIIDNKANENKYPVELLKKWKEDHESKAKNRKLISNPTLLGDAINALSTIVLDEDDLSGHQISPYNISDKITYNCVKRNKALIEEYRVYQSKINTLYAELEIQGSFVKENLLRNIKTIYLKIKGKYVGDSPNSIEIIRTNADNIIEDVEDELLELVENDTRLRKDDMDFGISIIMVDAFMRCKILEEPQNDIK